MIFWAIAAVSFIVFIFLISYVKAPPDTAFIISGLHKEPKVLIGRAGLRIPFLERMDKLKLELIQCDVKAAGIPTKDFIEVNVDAVTNVRIPKTPEFIRVASQHFLNKPVSVIAGKVQEVLEGNMREIVGQIDVRTIVTDKKVFAEKVSENVYDDMKALGLEIVSFNVQDVKDEKGVINNLGVDNLVAIQKDAAISRANSERDIKIAQAKADEEGVKARAEADASIAEQQKILFIKQANFKKESDAEQAKADAAYKIQEAEQLKTINETTVLAETAKAEKLAELKAKEVAVKEQELQASVNKQADADLYRKQQEALVIVAQAEAKKTAMLLEAEGIKAMKQAEAEGNKAILLAEAEGLEKKAEAMSKMTEAAVLEMYFNVLPQIAKEVSAPLSAVDNIVMYGDSTTKLIEGGINKISQVNEIAKKTIGIDIEDLVNKFMNKVDKNDIKNIREELSELKKVNDEKSDTQNDEPIEP